MKISKRTIVMAVSMLLALSMTAFGTVAYMTSRDQVTNVFTFGNIQIEVDETDVTGSTLPDEDGDGNPEVDLNGDGTTDIEITVNPDGTITVDPTLPDADGDGNPEVDLDGDGIPDAEITVNPDGTITVDPTPGDDTDPEKNYDVDPTPEGDRVHKNEYKLVPGEVYVKDPRVTVLAGSEPCYVRMIIDINCYEDLKAIAEKYSQPSDLQSLLTQFIDVDASCWQQVSANVTDDVMSFEFYYKLPGAQNSIIVDGAAGKVELPFLFEQFKVPAYFQNEDLEVLGNVFKVDVHGHAVQSAAFGSDTEAWAAFKDQYSY